MEGCNGRDYALLCITFSCSQMRIMYYNDGEDSEHVNGGEVE